MHPTILRLGARPAETRPGQPRLHGLRMLDRIAPPRLIRDHIAPSPIMADNNVIGDCTSAGLANAIRAAAALNGLSIAISAEDAERF